MLGGGAAGGPVVASPPHIASRMSLPRRILSHRLLLPLSSPLPSRLSPRLFFSLPYMPTGQVRFLCLSHSSSFGGSSPLSGVCSFVLRLFGSCLFPRYEGGYEYNHDLSNVNPCALCEILSTVLHQLV